MESKNIIPESSLKSIEDILKEIPIGKDALYKRIKERGLTAKKIKGLNYYSSWQVEALKLKNERVEVDVKYYPLKSTETFYIYESKLNR